jgi:hypothetical protein
MIDALVGGRLHGSPKARTDKNGKRFATAVVRVSVRDGNAIFANVICFDESAVTALPALQDGDSAALSGEATPGVWTAPDGTTRPTLNFLAHGVLTQYHVARKRKLLRGLEDTAMPGELPFGNQFPGVA